jgi:hypothetical protein
VSGVDAWLFPPNSWVDEPTPMLRLVLPRDKRDRIIRRVAQVAPRRRCPVWGCSIHGLVVVLVDSEAEAVLCPRHALVDLAGQAVVGQPMFATAAW